jgi:hypothetical protein
VTQELLPGGEVRSVLISSPLMQGSVNIRDQSRRIDQCDDGFPSGRCRVRGTVGTVPDTPQPLTPEYPRNALFHRTRDTMNKASPIAGAAAAIATGTPRPDSLPVRTAVGR